jgi:hypothetical protein
MSRRWQPDQYTFLLFEIGYRTHVPVPILFIAYGSGKTIMLNTVGHPKLKCSTIDFFRLELKL